MPIPVKTKPAYPPPTDAEIAAGMSVVFRIAQLVGPLVGIPDELIVRIALGHDVLTAAMMWAVHELIERGAIQAIHIDDQGAKPAILLTPDSLPAGLTLASGQIHFGDYGASSWGKMWFLLRHERLTEFRTKLTAKVRNGHKTPANLNRSEGVEDTSGESDESMNPREAAFAEWWRENYERGKESWHFLWLVSQEAFDDLRQDLLGQTYPAAAKFSPAQLEANTRLQAMIGRFWSPHWAPETWRNAAIQLGVIDAESVPVNDEFAREIGGAVRQKWLASNSENILPDLGTPIDFAQYTPLLDKRALIKLRMDNGIHENSDSEITRAKKELRAIEEPGSNWRRFRIPFAELKSRGWHWPTDWNSKAE